MVPVPAPLQRGSEAVARRVRTCCSKATIGLHDHSCFCAGVCTSLGLHQARSRRHPSSEPSVPTQSGRARPVRPLGCGRQEPGSGQRERGDPHLCRLRAGRGRRSRSPSPSLPPFPASCPAMHLQQTTWQRTGPHSFCLGVSLAHLLLPCLFPRALLRPLPCLRGSSTLFPDQLPLPSVRPPLSSARGPRSHLGHTRSRCCSVE